MGRWDVLAGQDSREERHGEENWSVRPRVVRPVAGQRWLVMAREARSYGVSKQSINQASKQSIK